jgi:hypothetical protein
MAIAHLALGPQLKVVARKARGMATVHTAIRRLAVPAGQARVPVKDKAEIAHKALVVHRARVATVHKVVADDHRVTVDQPAAAPPAAAAIAPATVEQLLGVQPTKVPT